MELSEPNRVEELHNYRHDKLIDFNKFWRLPYNYCFYNTTVIFIKWIAGENLKKTENRKAITTYIPAFVVETHKERCDEVQG